MKPYDLKGQSATARKSAEGSPLWENKKQPSRQHPHCSLFQRQNAHEGLLFDICSSLHRAVPIGKVGSSKADFTLTESSHRVHTLNACNSHILPCHCILLQTCDIVLFRDLQLQRPLPNSYARAHTHLHSTCSYDGSFATLLPLVAVFAVDLLRERKKEMGSPTFLTPIHQPTCLFLGGCPLGEMWLESDHFRRGQKPPPVHKVG